MRASATMTRDVVCVPPELPLSRAWALMLELRVRHLPVVQRGSLVGIVSDRDVLARSALTDDGAVVVDDRYVGDAMTVGPFTCHTSTPVAVLAQTMIDHKIDALPVVAENDPESIVGLVTSTDLLWLLIDDQARVLPLEFTLRSASVEGSIAI